MKKAIVILAVILSAITASAQTDSIGVYAYTDDAYKSVTPIHYQQTKIGIGKAANIFSGSTSSNRFNGAAKFRLFFGSVSPDKLQMYFTFTNSFGIGDYGIGEFKVKKDSRQLSTVRGSIFGMKSGTAKSDNVNVHTDTVRPGVYDITVTGKPGEYCIMVTRDGAGAYYGVYDFTIEK